MTRPADARRRGCGAAFCDGWAHLRWPLGMVRSRLAAAAPWLRCPAPPVPCRNAPPHPADCTATSLVVRGSPAAPCACGGGPPVTPMTGARGCDQRDGPSPVGLTKRFGDTAKCVPALQSTSAVHVGGWGPVQQGRHAPAGASGAHRKHGQQQAAPPISHAASASNPRNLDVCTDLNGEYSTPRPRLAREKAGLTAAGSYPISSHWQMTAVVPAAWMRCCRVWCAGGAHSSTPRTSRVLAGQHWAARTPSYPPHPPSWVPWCGCTGVSVTEHDRGRGACQGRNGKRAQWHSKVLLPMAAGPTGVSSRAPHGAHRTGSPRLQRHALSM